MNVLPITIITIGLIVGLGLLIADVEMSKIRGNWDERRCDIPVMAVAGRFKPADDPRTPSQFAKDNFSFCTEKLAQATMDVAMAPVSAVMNQQAEVAGGITYSLTRIRTLIAKVYEGFMSYINGFFKRYQHVIYEVSRVVQHLKLAFGRVSAIAMSMIFTGLTMIKGMMNTIDFAIRVVVILLGIIVALLIILFFILFPFIPFFLTLIVGLMAVVAGTTAGSLEAYREAFCFAGGTRVVMADGRSVPIREIRVGDVLATGAVTAVMRLDGSKTPLYDLEGVRVSGSHLVAAADGKWHAVADDSRAVATAACEAELYCLNTAGRIIPVTAAGNTILFRDWEEMDAADISGQYGWTYTVLSMLNANGPQPARWPATVAPAAIPLMTRDTLIPTRTGVKRVADIELGDLVGDMGADGQITYTEVIGVVDGAAPEGTQQIVADRGEWIRVGAAGLDRGCGIFTQSGTHIVASGGRLSHVRDFSEVGHAAIDATYSYVASRLARTGV